MAYKKRFLLAALTTVALLLSGCGASEQQASTSNVDSSSQGSSEVSSTSSSESGTQSSEGSESSSSGEKTVSSISVKANTVPTSFYVGDTFSVEGGVLQVNYSDNTRASVNMTLDMITNAPDMFVAHENYEVNVLYEGATTSYTINVLAQDVREEVSIEVSYDYNGSDWQVVTGPLTFVQGRSYHFDFGCYPTAAYDSINYKYYEVDGDNLVPLTDKPYEIGQYVYSVYIAEGDEGYKPVKVDCPYSIVASVIHNFVLNAENAPTLTSVASDDDGVVDGININIHNAKAAENGFATLVKNCDADVNPNENDNYIEIASPVKLTSEITVSFSGKNRYIYVFGAYELGNYYLVDTLTAAKQTTSRANGYCYFRFVCASLTSDKEVAISSISFSYEEDGLPLTMAAIAENSDLINSISNNPEEGAAYKREETYDAERSNKSIGLRSQEIYAHINFGFAISASELKNYTISFKYKPYNVNEYIYKEAGVDYDCDSVGIYMKPINGTTRLGDHKKLASVEKTGDWETFTLANEECTNGDNLAERFFISGSEQEITGVDIWLSTRVVGPESSFACVLIDDFRLIQLDTYPVECVLTDIQISGMTTQFNVGDTFVFDGVITAHYSDASTAVIALDNPGLTISSPDMSDDNIQVVEISFTDDGVTKTVSYKITVGDPKSKETQSIVSDTFDLANTTYRQINQSSMDSAKIANEHEMTYGNSTNSLKVSNLKSADASFFLKLPTKLDENVAQTKVKFFIKNLPATDGIYVQLLRELEVNAEGKAAKPSSTTEKTAKAYASNTKTPAFTATNAGNDWTMYEYTFDTSMITSGVGTIWFAIPSKSVQSSSSAFYIIDGIEVTSVIA